MNNEKRNENEVKSTFEKIEKGAVEGFNKVSDGAIKTLFSKDAEIVEDTKKRLSGKMDQ